MKHLSQIGSHTQHIPSRTARLRSFGRRVRWGHVAQFIVFVVTASIAFYAVRNMAGAINSISSQ